MKRQPMLWSAIILATLALLEILFSSPLFATLGFEYSALMGLALSYVCGVWQCLKMRQAGGSPPIWPAATREIFVVLKESIILSIVPLAISLLSLSFLSNCSVWDGFFFY